MDLKGGSTVTLSTLPTKAAVRSTVRKRTLPPKSAATAMSFSFKTCKNIVSTMKTVAFAKRFH